MILGVAACDDASCARIVERVARTLPEVRVVFSVRGGVAIAAWQSRSQPARFAEDHACLGLVVGSPPLGSVGELRGDFAMVARVGTKLRLARARFGGRPLFWMRYEGTVVACSRFQPLALLARPHAQLNVDHLLAAFDVRLRFERPAPISGVVIVQANTVVQLSAAGETSVLAGRLHIGPELALGAPELAAMLRDQIGRAIERHTADLDRVAVLGGGGVDSSNVLAHAVRIASDAKKAAPIAAAYDFAGPGDDRPHLRALCDHLSIVPIRAAIQEGATHSGRDWIVDGWIHTFGLASVVISLLAKAKDAGARAVLTGDGSELSLQSDPGVFADYARRAPLAALACVSRFRTVVEARPDFIRRMLVAPVARALLPEFIVNHRVRRGKERLARLREREFPWAGPRLRATFEDAARGVEQPLAADQRGRVTDLASSPILMAIREHASRWEILCDIPIHFPYCDDDLLQFLGRVPSPAIFMNARERGLLVASMEELVPDSLRYRRDKGRPQPAFLEAYRAMGGADGVAHLIDMRELEKLGIVHSDSFRSAFDAFAARPEADPKAWGTVWGTLTAEAYARWFHAFKRGDESDNALDLSA